MKKIILLFILSITFNAHAGPTLEETIDFLLNGDDNQKIEFTIEDCVLTYNSTGVDIVAMREYPQKNIIDFKKTNASTIKETTGRKGGLIGPGIYAKCTGPCFSAIDLEFNKKVDISDDSWGLINLIPWDRNEKAIGYLFSEYCPIKSSAF